jgi:hypothetical protein
MLKNIHRLGRHSIFVTANYGFPVAEEIKRREFPHLERGREKIVCRIMDSCRLPASMVSRKR